MSYTVYVNDVLKEAFRSSFTEGLLLPDQFEVEFKPTVTVTAGDTIKIKRNGTEKFRGIAEIRRRPLADPKNLWTGRDKGSVKLSHYMTESVWFDDVEPSQLTRFLNMPSQILTAETVRDGFGSDYDWGMATYCYVWEQHGLVWKIKCSKQAGAAFLRAYLYRTPAADSETNTSMVVRLKIDSCQYEGDTSDPDICAGLVARFTDANNFYAAYLGWDSANSRKVLRIAKLVAGVLTTVATSTVDVGWQFGEYYTFRFILSSTSLTVIVDELNARLTTTDASFASGKFGLLSGNAHTNFTDLIVQKIGTATASSTAAGASAGAAFDGDPVSYWRADSNVEQWWLQYDLGASKTDVCAVLIRLSLEPTDTSLQGVMDAPGIIIEYSTNDVDYTQISSDNYVRCSDHLKVFTPVTMRYLKIKSVAAINLPRPKLFEVELYQATEGGAILTEGTLHDYEDGIEFQCEYEPRSEAIRRVAEQIGWNVWSDISEQLNFMLERGTVRRKRRIIASADTEVDAGAPAVPQDTATLYAIDVSPSVCRIFVKHDISDIAATAVLLEAALHLYPLLLTGYPFNVQVRRADAAWAEATLTWNNQPAATLVSTFSFTGNFPSRTEVDVTALVADWIDEDLTNNGLCLRAETESGADKTIGFSQKDNTDTKSYLLSRMLELWVDYYTTSHVSDVSMVKGTNIYEAELEEDNTKIVWKAKIRGWGQAEYQVSSEYEDTDVKTAYPTLAAEFVASEKDLRDPAIAYALAKRIVAARSTPKQRLHIVGRDVAEVAWGAGDLITCTISDLGISGAWRVLSITRAYDDYAETVTLDLMTQTQASLLGRDEDLTSFLTDMRSRIKQWEKISQQE